MKNDNPESILKSLEQFSDECKSLKLESQAHARSMLSILTSSEKDWPRFRKDLDRRLYYMSHYLIFESLNLLELETNENEAKLYLKNGAEVLEYLYKYRGLDENIKLEVLLKSIFAYYISGNFARAYVLTKEINELENYNLVLKLIVSLMKKNLKESRLTTIEIFNDSKYKEQVILDQLVQSKIDEDEAISRVLEYSISKTVSYYIEYVKTGDRELFKMAISILDKCIKLAKSRHFPDMWWWIYCFSFIFKEYQQNSFWNLLKPFYDDSRILESYIKNYLTYDPPITELWPSQVHAIPMINDEERRDFCLKMPTSSGKTQIAELTILRFLLDSEDSEKKCVYIAPYRSLAVEIEKSFKKSLGSIGFKVSEIYGKFELNPAEKVLIGQNRIVVVTPEKFDAILRYFPEMWDNIGLIVIDEGHIIDPNERGLNFEFFIQRLLIKFKDKDCRFLFISAVLPNADEFAKWITGSPGQLVQSQWRPSRQMIGLLTWSGKSASINYTHTEEGQFDQDCFVPAFIEKNECAGIPGVGKRRNAFPHDSREALALSALLFARESTTLVFIPKKIHIESFSKDLIGALKFQSAIERSKGNNFSLPSPNKDDEIFRRCVRIINSELGEDSDLINYLENGFIIHHAGLPGPVRIAIEDLIRSNQISLIVATSTLAEGVNLPLKTVIVKDLYYGRGQLVDPLRFWNVCGRAGRAGKENEGQILFYLDKTVKSYDNKLKDIKGLISGLETSKVISTLFRVLNTIVKEWKRSYPKVDVGEFCIYLANNSYEWVSEKMSLFIRKWINILDSHLLSLSEESNMENISPESLQEILNNSLLFIQIQNSPSNLIDEKLAAKLLYSRITYINSTYPKGIRKRFYKLNMRLPTCEKIEKNRDMLYELFNYAFYWEILPEDEKIQLLIQLSEFILNLEEIVEHLKIPEQWSKIVSLWLLGLNTTDMMRDEYIREFTSDSTQLRLFIEDFCVYRLPWGLNSILNYLKSYIEEEGKEDIPIVSNYFSGMFKYGVSNPKAVCILPYLDQRRDLALKISEICPFEIKNPDMIIEWFKELTKEDLILKGISSYDSQEIIKTRDFNIYERMPLSQRTLRIESNNEIIKGLSENEQLIIVPRENNEIQILKLDGDEIGKFTIKGTIPSNWFNLHLINVFVKSIESLEGFHRLKLAIESY